MSKLILTAELAYQHYLSQVHYNENEYDEKRDKLVHRASMGGRCHRLQKYHLSPDHESKALTPEDMAVFRIGTVFHEELQKGFDWLFNIKETNKDNSSIELKMEEKLSINLHGCQIEGHSDARIFDHDKKLIQITDLKTMNPRAMSYFKKDPYSKTGYIIQIGTYALATKKQYPDYEIILLLSAWDKDKGNFFEVELDYNRCTLAADNYYRELAETMKLELDEIVPIQHPKAPINTKWECDYCNYNHICPSPKIKRV